MRFFRPVFFTGVLYPEVIFRLRTTDKFLCLTFDDGPDPDSTPQLLEILDSHKVKALFFCDGAAAEKYPVLIDQMKSEGHIIGNHGYNHLSGFTTSLNRYVADITKASRFTSSIFFRPQYGHLRFTQYKKLSKVYKIFYWDIMPYDFDKSFGSENSLRILKNKVRPGSIIVLHDNHDSFANTIIDDFISFAENAGFKFKLPYGSLP